MTKFELFSMLALLLVVGCSSTAFEGADGLKTDGTVLEPDAAVADATASNVDAASVDAVTTDSAQTEPTVDTGVEASADTAISDKCLNVPDRLLINEIKFEPKILAVTPQHGINSYVEILNVGECPVMWLHDLTWYGDDGNVYELTHDGTQHPIIAPGGRILVGTPNYSNKSNANCFWIESYAYPYSHGKFMLTRGMHTVVDSVYVVPAYVTETGSAVRIPTSFDTSLARWPDGNDEKGDVFDFQAAPPSPCAANVAPN